MPSGGHACVFYPGGRGAACLVGGMHVSCCLVGRVHQAFTAFGERTLTCLRDKSIWANILYRTGKAAFTTYGLQIQW